jgi:hypothetical protein
MCAGLVFLPLRHGPLYRRLLATVLICINANDGLRSWCANQRQDRDRGWGCSDVVSVVVGRGVRAGRAGFHSKLETAPARATARAVGDRRGGWMHPGRWCRQAAKPLLGHSLNCVSRRARAGDTAAQLWGRRAAFSRERPIRHERHARWQARCSADSDIASRRAHACDTWSHCRPGRLGRRSPTCAMASAVGRSTAALG